MMKLFQFLIFFSFVTCCSEKESLVDKIPVVIAPVEQLSDSDLLDLVQKQTFKYFWDFAHPISGMARERSQATAYGGNSPEIVTTGGTGFGVMGMLAGVERKFITRSQAVERLLKITKFLLNGDRFHGAFPHWYNGTTGKVYPFSPQDNGGDLIETSFMIQGLLAARQYFDQEDPGEIELRANINKLWREVEWDWFTDGGRTLLWHWSPNFGFAINLEIRGWNESLVAYVLATSSPTFPIAPQLYHAIWAKGGDFKNDRTYYSKYKLALGPDYGGPLFFSHYSFLGIDPRSLKDQYADYWEQNRNHTLINRAYCIANPKGFAGYSEKSWGLTASDNHLGYSAHSPTNDLGVISPTAAISSIPYTPTESMLAIRHFYYEQNGKLWGQYGFFDAFNPTRNWVSDGYLAIDQGPIVVMIENHRSGLIWDRFMSNPEIKGGMKKLGFQSPKL